MVDERKDMNSMKGWRDGDDDNGNLDESRKETVILAMVCKSLMFGSGWFSL